MFVHNSRMFNRIAAADANKARCDKVTCDCIYIYIVHMSPQLEMRKLIPNYTAVLQSWGISNVYMD